MGVVCALSGVPAQPGSMRGHAACALRIWLLVNRLAMPSHMALGGRLPDMHVRFWEIFSATLNTAACCSGPVFYVCRSRRGAHRRWVRYFVEFAATCVLQCRG